MDEYTMREIRRDVENYLYEELGNLVDSFEDNLAMKLASAIPDYDPDWCLEEVDADYANYGISEIVDLEMDVLFGNAPE